MSDKKFPLKTIKEAIILDQLGLQTLAISKKLKVPLPLLTKWIQNSKTILEMNDDSDEESQDTEPNLEINKCPANKIGLRKQAVKADNENVKSNYKRQIIKAVQNTDADDTFEYKKSKAPSRTKKKHAEITDDIEPTFSNLLDKQDFPVPIELPKPKRKYLRKAPLQKCNVESTPESYTESIKSSISEKPSRKLKVLDESKSCDIPIIDDKKKPKRQYKKRVKSPNTDINLKVIPENVEANFTKSTLCDISENVKLSPPKKKIKTTTKQLSKDDNAENSAECIVSDIIQTTEIMKPKRQYIRKAKPPKVEIQELPEFVKETKFIKDPRLPDPSFVSSISDTRDKFTKEVDNSILATSTIQTTERKPKRQYIRKPKPLKVEIRSLPKIFEEAKPIKDSRLSDLSSFSSISDKFNKSTKDPVNSIPAELKIEMKRIVESSNVEISHKDLVKVSNDLFISDDSDEQESSGTQQKNIEIDIPETQKLKTQIKLSKKKTDTLIKPSGSGGWGKNKITGFGPQVGSIMPTNYTISEWKTIKEHRNALSFDDVTLETKQYPKPPPSALVRSIKNAEFNISPKLQEKTGKSGLLSHEEISRRRIIFTNILAEIESNDQNSCDIQKHSHKNDDMQRQDAKQIDKIEICDVNTDGKFYADLYSEALKELDSVMVSSNDDKSELSKEFLSNINKEIIAPRIIESCELQVETDLNLSEVDDKNYLLKDIYQTESENSQSVIFPSNREKVIDVKQISTTEIHEMNQLESMDLEYLKNDPENVCENVSQVDTTEICDVNTDGNIYDDIYEEAMKELDSVMESESNDESELSQEVLTYINKEITEPKIETFELQLGNCLNLSEVNDKDNLLKDLCLIESEESQSIDCSSNKNSVMANVGNDLYLTNSPMTCLSNKIIEPKIESRELLLGNDLNLFEADDEDNLLNDLLLLETGESQSVDFLSNRNSVIQNVKEDLNLTESEEDSSIVSSSTSNYESNDSREKDSKFYQCRVFQSTGELRNQSSCVQCSPGDHAYLNRIADELQSTEPRLIKTSKNIQSTDCTGTGSPFSKNGCSFDDDW